MQHAPHTQTRRTPSAAVVVSPATSVEVALLFPGFAGLILLLLAL